MKKVFGQTVRDIKREVNKKVLKVPSMEQKVLDATSNEPWGPHGSNLADIAQATRNYNEYQMIMSVLWKRINDTGKNWRHVYKALTVLEYLVAHGSERVIDEIREHAYQISTLSDFQYIDSSGRDQGNNVRKKSQSLVTLVNDKERIQEARQKAAANRDKFRGPSSTGGMYRPGSYSSTSGGYGDRYDDDRYGYRDDDRNGYGRERDWANRDDDQYGRGGDSYGRDHYSRDSDERYGRDGYRDDDYRGGRNNDDYRNGPRSRSSEREKDRSYEDDDPYSSRSGTGRADDRSPDERQVERKLSEVNTSTPPAYEEVIAVSQNQATDGRDGRTVAPPLKESSPPPGNTSQPQPTSTVNVAASSPIKEEVEFDEFDPRAPVSAAAPPASSTAEVDLFGALSDSNALALVPVTSETTTSQPNEPVTSSFGANFVPLSSASTVLNQPAENPFGDAPFKAFHSEDSFTPQPQGFVATSPFQQQSAVSESSIPPQPAGLKTEPVSNFEFVDTFLGITFSPASVPNAQFPLTTPEYSSQVPSTADPSNDILGGILPQTGSAAGPVAAQSAFSAPAATPLTSQAAFPAPAAAPLASQAAFPSPAATPFTSQAAFPAHAATPLIPEASFSAPAATPLTSQPGFSAPAATPVDSQAAFSAPAASPAAFQAAIPGNAANSVAYTSIAPGFANSAVASQTGFVSMPAASHAPVPGFTTMPVASQATVPGFAAMPIASQVNVQVPTTMSIASQAAAPAPVRTLSGPAALPVTSQASFLDATGTTARSQPPKDKFETKSNVWSDTLNRGLVNLNISGPKINPLADIGIDFDSINRMEKRKEKSSAAPATSTVTMGKAMGYGSGIGRAGVSGLAAPPNPMMGSGMGMGMGAGAGMGMGMGMGGYGGMNRPMGAMGGMNQPMGMNMGMGMGMGMGMNMGMAQGAAQMRPAAGLPQAGSGMPVGYNPMMGMGGYTSQQPYGGYR